MLSLTNSILAASDEAVPQLKLTFRRSKIKERVELEEKRRLPLKQKKNQK
jgi:hypothetical protein